MTVVRKRIFDFDLQIFLNVALPRITPVPVLFNVKLLRRTAALFPNSSQDLQIYPQLYELLSPLHSDYVTIRVELLLI